MRLVFFHAGIIPLIGDSVKKRIIWNGMLLQPDIPLHSASSSIVRRQGTGTLRCPFHFQLLTFNSLRHSSPTCPLTPPSLTDPGVPAAPPTPLLDLPRSRGRGGHAYAWWRRHASGTPKTLPSHPHPAQNRSMTMLPQEVIARKRDGEDLTAGEIGAFIAGLTDGTRQPRPGRGLRHGGVLPRHDHARARGADRGDARQRHRARLVRPRWPGRRQALDRRRRRQCLADAGADPCRLRRLCADDLGPRPRPYRRHARQVRCHPRLHDQPRQRAVPQGGAERPAAPSSARPPISPRPTRCSIRSATSPRRSSPSR